MKVEELNAAIDALNQKVALMSAKIEELEAKLNAPKAEVKEMSDDDAMKILNGEFRDLKHKEAAEKLGLTYGQVYSARNGYTFKHIVKKLKDENVKNQWIK